jgi:hypothetical protein
MSKTGEYDFDTATSICDTYQLGLTQKSIYKQA